MPVGTFYIGQLSDAEKVAFFNSTAQENFQQAFDRPQDLTYTYLARVKTPKDLGLTDSKTLEKVSFGFSPPNARMEEMVDGKTGATPLDMHSIEVKPKAYGSKQFCLIEDFDKDVFGILDRAPRNLRRVAEKNPDVLVAGLYRNGKTVLDYTGNKNFWDTGHKSSPEGSNTATFDNLYSNAPLTEHFLAQGVMQMHSIKAPDGDGSYALGVKPTALVIPPTLEHDAYVACRAASIVYSNGNNPAPGQVAGATAAQGENVIATLLRWITKIIVVPELQDGQSINNTSWYLIDDRDGGCWGFCYAMTMAPIFISLMNPKDPNVFFQDKYYWGTKKREGVNYGLSQFAARFEA